MSLLDSNSLERAFSFMPSFSRLVTNTLSPSEINGATSALKAGFYRNLKYCKHLGEGAVFVVSLYEHPNGELFAVKRTRLGQQRSRGKADNPVGGIFSAFTEIHVTWHENLKRHENIIKILSWDWSEDRIPLVIAEYAPQGTLRDFLLAQGDRLSGNSRRDLCLDIAAGLTALHACDVAHGDVKTANALVFPHPHRQWQAKVSDFSHSIFGVSGRKKSAYPGSGSYNAPEIRARDSIIASDLLPRCETFSYGLLVWEVLKNGECFFEQNWLSERHWNSIEEKNEAAIKYLDALPKDELLARAECWIGAHSSMSSTTRSTFQAVLKMSLRENPNYRKDMSDIAISLDSCDRYRPHLII